MNGRNDPNSNGCGLKIISAIFTVVFGIALTLSLFVLGPELETYLELQVCQPDTIVKTGNGRGKDKTVICVDKKTGRKINVSSYQYFSCCPLAIVIFFIIIYSIIILVFRSSKISNSQRKQI